MTDVIFAAGEIWTNPILVGLVVAIPTFVLGLLATRRAEKMDKAALQAVMVTAQGDSVQRVINGLDIMVDNLQADNKEARDKTAELREQLKQCNSAYAELRRLMNEEE